MEVFLKGVLGILFARGHSQTEDEQKITDIYLTGDWIVKEKLRLQRRQHHQLSSTCRRPERMFTRHNRTEVASLAQLCAFNPGRLQLFFSFYSFLYHVSASPSLLPTSWSFICCYSGVCLHDSVAFFSLFCVNLFVVSVCHSFPDAPPPSLHDDIVTIPLSFINSSSLL